MSRGDVGLVLGLAGFLLGAFAVYEAHTMKGDVESLKNERKHDEDTITGIGNRVEKLDLSMKDLTRRVNEADGGPRSSADRLRGIEERLDALEKRGPAPAAPTDTDGRISPNGEAPKAEGKWTKEKIDDLAKRLFGGAATDADKALLKDALAAVESEVKDSPRDIDARLRLAQLYIAKLMTVPEGMEQGAWSMKAVAQWKAVLDLDANNWDAHYSLGSNYSFWPEQFNKRPEAIKEFEAARKVQEQTAPDPKHADTYLQLHLLYLKQGKTEQAKEVLDDGLRRFPDDEELKTARDGAK